MLFYEGAEQGNFLWFKEGTSIMNNGKGSPLKTKEALLIPTKHDVLAFLVAK